MKNFFNKLKNINKIFKTIPIIATGVTLNDQQHKKSNAEIFSKFHLFEGQIPSCFNAEPYGSLVRRSFFQLEDYPIDTFHPKCLPLANEEYFEWIDMLESINLAKGNFTMVELGAGFGRWIVSAAVLLKNHKNIPFHLVGVEAEKNHFQMMKQHFIDNDLDPLDHNLIQAAVSKNDTSVHFFQGSSSEWWGQFITKPNKRMNDFPDSKVEEVKGVSVDTILKNIEFVDLIDIDIQGEEAKVIGNSLEILNNKVKRIHIGTHSHKIEKTLFNYFSDLGWICYNNLPCFSTHKTQYGNISFEDGVQTWINPTF